ncbi:MAG: hypothetical protein HYU84_01930 [Chloroflexi bacterium]|nr:hypothetical protein [Chloroflexota bacterium]MBI3170160.1 hypothetical protein [Chloroflexota bacterium]
MEKWREEIVHGLRYLEENRGIKLDELQDNDLFISIVSQATTIAIRTHQKEKLEALKSAIVNSVTSSKMEEDFQLTFIRFIDELSPSHLNLLKFFINNEEEIKFLKSYPAIYQLISRNNTSISKNQFKLLIGDLNIRGLIHISIDIEDFEEIYQASSILWDETNDELPRLIVTDIAKKFIHFISDYKGLGD